MDDDVIDELVNRAQAEGLQPTGEGGITDRLGYDKHDPAGKNGANSRNGKRSKTVRTDRGQRWTMRWKTALRAFDMTFDGRLSATRQ
ncbi:hypothetical protein SMA5143A_7555 [Streptomyces sp. MA5143a]|nr:hypothetical protein SMA5143A_7555 [Streptomyces sp. MA5143a]